LQAISADFLADRFVVTEWRGIRRNLGASHDTEAMIHKGNVRLTTRCVKWHTRGKERQNFMKRTERTEKAETTTAKKKSITRKQVEIEKFIVHFLPDFTIDFRTDVKARSVYCGEIVFGSDPMAEIQDRFIEAHGAGHFRLTKQLTGGKMGGSFVLSVPEPEPVEDEDFETEPSRETNRERFIVQKSGLDSSTVRDVARVAAAEVAQEFVSKMQPASIAQTGQQSDGFNQWLETVEKVEAFKSKLAPNQAAATMPQATNDRPFDERLLETVIVKALDKSNNESTLDKVLDVLGGTRTKEPSIWENLGEFIKPLMPVVGQMAASYLMNQQATPQQTVMHSPPTQTPVQQPSSVAPSQSPATQQAELSAEQKAFLRLMQRVKEDIEDNAPVEAVVASFDSFAERFPQSAGIAFLLTATPQTLLEQLQLEPSIDRILWVQNFQAELKNFEEGNDVSNKDEE
jgi:hypothetical protein